MKSLNLFIPGFFSAACVYASLVSTTVWADQITQYFYTNQGKILKEVSPGGHTTTHTYNPDGFRATTTNAEGLVTRFNSYDAGRLTSVTDPNGLTTELSYYPGGELKSVTRKHPTDATLESTTLYEVDATGLLKQVTLPNGNALHYEYSPANQLKAIVNDAGERIEAELDAAGNHTKEEIKNASGEVVFSQTRTLDELSRVMDITGNHGQNLHTTFDAGDNPDTQTDAKQHKTQTEYDVFERPIKVIDAAGGQVTTSYDVQGNVHTVTDQRGNTTTYDFNALGYLEQLTSPDTGVTRYQYDDAGNRTEQIDARNVVTEYDYDGLHRLTSITYPAAPGENVNFFYDEASATNQGKGFLSRITTADGNSIAYEYSMGQVSKKTVVIGSISKEILYQHSPAGELTKLTYPNGRIVNYAFDKGKLVGITTQTNSGANSQSILSNIEYLPFGPARNYSFGNGLTETRSYDTDYRLEAIDVGNFNLSYSFDSVDSIEKIINNLLPTPTQTFGYDSLNRLVTASGTYGNLSWSFDSTGNRLSETRNSITDWYAYSPTSNRLNSISRNAQQSNSRRGAITNGNRQFLHDAAGNRKMANTEVGTQQVYMFNNAGRLSGVAVNPKSGGPVVTYLYNPLGERVSKSVNGVLSEAYIWDEAGRLLQVLNSNGESVRDYIYFDGQQIAVVMKGQIYYLHNDHLGVAQVITNAAQAVVSVANYEPFGKLVSAGVDIGSRLPGQFADLETGTFYNYFRDYDAIIGRYIESDPIGLGGGINTYSYVGGNPVGNIDTLGLDTYVVNRDLSAIGKSSRSWHNPITHTFTFTTNTDGSIANTYSWGNGANLTGWNMNQPEDLKAAIEALKNGNAQRVAPSFMDFYYHLAFRLLDDTSNNHSNGIITNNCKSETIKLNDLAWSLAGTTTNKPKSTPIYLQNPLPAFGF